MPKPAQQNPVQRFIRHLVGKFESDRTEMVEQLGYRDLALGRFHLDSWLDRGEGYDRILSEIAAAYPDRAEELERALDETAEMKAAAGDVEWRNRCRLEDASFLQFIHVDGERTVPEGIVLFGISGGRFESAHRGSVGRAFSIDAGVFEEVSGSLPVFRERDRLQVLPIPGSLPVRPGWEFGRAGGEAVLERKSGDFGSVTGMASGSIHVDRNADRLDSVWHRASVSRSARHSIRQQPRRPLKWSR